MDELTKPAPAPASELSILQEQYDSLRHSMVSILVLLIVMAGTANIYLFRQYRNDKADVLAIRPSVQKAVEDYNRSFAPLLAEFHKRLLAFGQTNESFRPILEKYNIRPQGNTGTAAPAKSTAPPPAKK